MRNKEATIKQAELHDIYVLYQEQPAEHVWIDVRTPDEWSDGTIPGIRRIGLDQLPKNLSELDKSNSYVLVCRSGGRSGGACQFMAAAGFGHLINFKCGMLAWYGAGYPLE